MKLLDDFFEKEEEYKIDKVMATTFTVTPMFVSEILLRMIAYDEPAIVRGTICQKKLALKRIFENKDISNKLLILANDFQGQERVAEELINGRNLYLKRFLEANLGSVIQTIKVKNGFFHPKLILMQLKNNDGCYKYRLLVSSKNLVKDNYYQLGMQFESVPKDDEQMSSKSLCEFISNMQKIVGKKEFFGDVIDNLPKVGFNPVGVPQDNIIEMDLLFGLPGRYINKSDTFKDNLVEVLKGDLSGKTYWDIVTDSLDINFLCQSDGNFRSPERKNVRIVDNAVRWSQQAESLDALKQKCTPLVPNSQDGSSPQYIHAKVISGADADERITWIGSANFTSAAFNNNYECCVRFVTSNPNNDSKNDFLNSIPGLLYRDLIEGDLQSAETETLKNELQLFLSDKNKFETQCKLLNVENSELGINIEIRDACIQKGKCIVNVNKANDKDVVLKKIIVQLPYGYGMVENEVTTSAMSLTMKYKKGSIRIVEGKLRMILTGIFGVGHQTQQVSVWREVEPEPKVTEEEQKDLETYKNELLKKNMDGTGLFRDELPSLRDAIPPHERMADTNNAELLLATYLGNEPNSGKLNGKLKEVAGNITLWKEFLQACIDDTEEKPDNIDEYKKRLKSFEKYEDILNKLVSGDKNE